VFKNRVINGFKGSGEIKKTESSEFVLSHGLDDVVMNRKKRGFSRMVGCVSRLDERDE